MSKLDSFRKQAKQNRVNRVVKKEKTYGNTKRSKSSKAYIEGDISKSAQGGAYYIKEQRRKGERAYGYEADDLYTGGRKASNYKALKRGENPYQTKYLAQKGTKVVPGGVYEDSGEAYGARRVQNRRFLSSDEAKSFDKYGDISVNEFKPKKGYINWNEREKGGQFKDRLKTGKLDGIAIAKENQRKGKHISNAFEYVKGGLKDFVGDPLVDVLKTGDRYGSSALAGLGGALEQSGNIFKGVAEGKVGKYYDKGLVKRNVNKSLRESDETGWGASQAEFLKQASDNSYRQERKYFQDKGDADMLKHIQRSDRDEKYKNVAGNIAGFGLDVGAPTIVSDKIGKTLNFLGKRTVKSGKDMFKGTADLSMGILPDSMRDIRGKSFNVSKGVSNASDDVFFPSKNVREQLENGINGAGKFAEENARLDNMYKNAVSKPEIKTGMSRVDNFIEQLRKRRKGNATENGMFNPNQKVLDMHDSRFDDIADRVIESSAHREPIKDAYTKSDKLFNGKDKRQYGEALQRIAQENNLNLDSIQDLNKAYNILEEGRKFKTVEPVKARRSIAQNADEFRFKVDSYINNTLPLKSIDELVEISKSFKEMGRKLNKSNVDVNIKRLNQILFDGKEVIRNNVPHKDLKQVIDYLEDVSNYHIANNSGASEFVMRDKSGKSKVFKMIDKNGKRVFPENKVGMFARNMVDDLFEDKKSLKSDAIGVKYLSEVKDPFKILDNRIKNGEVLNPQEMREYNSLKNRLDIWDKIHNETRDLDFDEYNEYVAKNYPKLNKSKGYNEAIDEVADSYKRSVDPNKIDFEEKQIANVKYKEALDEVRNLAGTKYVDYSKAVVSPHVKQTPKILNSVPWTRDSIDNVKKLLTQELEFKLKGDTYKSNVAREEMKKIVYKMKELGIDDKAYFDQIKQFKNDIYSKATKKNTKLNPLEKTGLKLNVPGKVTDDMRRLSDLESEYIMSQGAKSFDELFDALDPKIAQRGDNMGDEISSMLRPNQESNYVDPFEAFTEAENLRDNKLPNNAVKELSQETKNVLPDMNPSEADINERIAKLDDITGGRSFKDVPTQFDEVTQELIDHGVKPDQAPPKQKPKDMSDNAYNRWLTSWKKGVTIYNPGWHVQNFFQNKGQNYLAFGTDALMPQTNARNILKEIQGKPNKAQNVTSFVPGKMQTYSPQEIGKMAQELGVLDSFGSDAVQSKGIFAKLEDKVDNSWIMKLLGKSEQTARLNHFIKKLEQGATPEDAVKSVNKYLFDYNKANEFEKKVMKNVDPFWTFHKNNARLLTQSSLEHNGKMNNIMRGTRGLENGVPSDEKQEFDSRHGKDVQQPHASLKDAQNGAQYNYLYDQQMFPQLKNAIPVEDSEFESKLNPLLKIALEVSRGEGNFGNKVVDKDEAGWNEVTKDERFGEILRDVNPFMPTVVNALHNTNQRQEKADNDKVSQSTTDKQILNEWIKYITGHKGNYYRNMK